MIIVILIYIIGLKSVNILASLFTDPTYDLYPEYLPQIKFLCSL